MPLTLKPIDKNTWHTAIRLEVAPQLYADLGFEPTGRVEEGEIEDVNVKKKKAP